MDMSFFECSRHNYACSNNHISRQQNTTLLAENGKKSSSRRTRHLDVCYFFVIDKIKKGKVKVAFCSTHDMLGDFFTKALQGNQFVCMRDKILNFPSSASTTEHRSVLEESFSSESFKNSKQGSWD